MRVRMRVRVRVRGMPSGRTVMWRTPFVVDQP
jgi:hypothetical protein